MKDNYAKLNNGLGNKVFTVKDVCKLLGVKRSTAYWIMHTLIREKKLVRIMRGRYIISTPGTTITLPKEIDSLAKHLLRTITRPFRFTGLSILESFVHHLPRVIFYHLYVEPGSAEDFKAEIEKKSKIVVLVKPTADDLRLLLEHIDAKEVIIIQENNYHYVRYDGSSSPELAFIDLYFEATRERIPFIKADLDEIFKSLVLNTLINFSTMMRYAQHRGLGKEIRVFLKKLAPYITIPRWAL